MRYYILMTNVSPLTVDNLERTLINSARGGAITFIDNPYAQLGEIELLTVMQKLEATPQCLKLVTGRTPVEGVSQVLGEDSFIRFREIMIPARSSVMLGIPIPVQNPRTNSDILHVGFGKYLSVAAIGKTLLQNGRLGLSLRTPQI